MIKPLDRLGVGVRKVAALVGRGRTSLTLLAIGFGNLGIGLVTTIVLARLLPKAAYGQYLFALGLVNIAALPIELGLPTLMMREIARYRADADQARIAAIIVWVLAFVSCSFILVGSGFMLYLAYGERGEKIGASLQLWAFALLPALALMNWARGVLQGFERPIQFALPDSIFRPVLLLLGVGLAALGGVLNEVSVMMAHVAAVALCFLWSVRQSIAVLRQADVRLRFRREDMDWQAWLASLLPITLVSGVRIVNRRIDIVLIGALGTTAAVAGYNVALQITGMILVGQTVLNQMLGPKIAFAHRLGDIRSMQHHIAFATVIASGLAVASVLAIVGLGPWLIPFVFGPEYASTYLIVAILCVGQLFSGLMGPTSLLLNMSRFERKTLRTGILAAVVNIALSALLVPPLHAIGAAIASSVTLLVIQSQRWWMVREHIGVRSDIIMALGFLRSGRDIG